MAYWSRCERDKHNNFIEDVGNDGTWTVCKRD